MNSTTIVTQAAQRLLERNIYFETTENVSEENRLYENEIGRLNRKISELEGHIKRLKAG